MKKKSYQFSARKVAYFLDSNFSDVTRIVGSDHHVFVTDQNIFNLHKKKFKDSRVIVLPAGEQHKIQSTVDSIINQLIEYKTDRNSWLIGVGGGVITDITGYVASVYMRGIRYGFIPTTILAMVDAAVGGKNGIDVGVYKNLVGTISQPHFLLYDLDFLKSLPQDQWVNGFAEIIKHASIRDSLMFRMLQTTRLASIRKDREVLEKLISRNVLLKTKVVLADEFENGDRRLLNFGHTLGHAIENRYQLLHGHAISIGMVAAARLSERLTGFKSTEELVEVLDSFGLPTSYDYNREEVFDILTMDKKRTANEMKFVLLERIGKATVIPIRLPELRKMLNTL